MLPTRFFLGTKPGLTLSSQPLLRIPHFTFILRREERSCWAQGWCHTNSQLRGTTPSEGITLVPIMCQAMQALLSLFWRGVKWGSQRSVWRQDSNLVCLQSSMLFTLYFIYLSAQQRMHGWKTSYCTLREPILRAQSNCIHWLLKDLRATFHKNKQRNKNVRGTKESAEKPTRSRVSD